MLIPKGGNDKVYTPNYLAKWIVDYFKPTGQILEPCKGKGAFLKYLPKNTNWCEIDDKGVDFFDCNTLGYNWAITNPPFSQIRQFLNHCYKLKIDNIVFLCPTNHIIGMKARNRDMKENGYGIKEIIFIDTPKEFPQSGFQWSVNHIKKGYKGNIKLKHYEKK